MVKKSIAEIQADKRREEALNQQGKTDAANADEQQKFDWQKLSEKWKKDAEDAKNGSLDATITDMVITNAGAVYGDKAKDPERFVMSMKITAQDGKQFTETFSMPEGAGSWRNKQFKLGQFLNKYGDMPAVGMAVKVAFNDEGFYRLAL